MKARNRSAGDDDEKHRPYKSLPRNIPIDDAEKFASFLLTDFSYEGKTVMVAPGLGFYASPGRGQNECRIAYVLKAEDLKDAMNLLRRGVEAYNSKI